MKITNNIRTYIALLAGIALLASCSDDVTAPTYTVGEADNAIVLRAGISEGSTSVATRAGAEDHHTTPGHKTFTASTKLTLRVDGTWKGKADGTAPHGTITGTLVSQETTATIGDAFKGDAVNDTENTHNKVTFTPAEQLYWDDYGSADPANIDAPKGTATAGTGGRDKGLTIYGVAINGKTDAAPTVSNWTALAWNMGTPTGSPLTLSQTGGWDDKDLLISNNVKEGGPDDTYKFDERASGKLLEFTHAMSKITVRLIASEGFPTTGVGATAKRFANAPEVKLTSNETGQSNAEWAYTSGSVNVETGEVTGQSNPAVITMHTAKTDDSQYTVIYDALVAPGSVFGEASGSPATYPVIARINADGNIYYVTSEKIREKISELITASKHNNEYKTEPGKNYVLTVNVKKTKIEVTATIKDWVDIESDEVAPVIDVNISYGGTGTFDKDNFSFYRSLLFDKDYSKDYSGNANSYFAAEATVTKPTAPATKWIFSTPLFWPNHNTHYQMRGVWPLTGTGTGDVNYPRVETATHGGQDYQVIKVNNVAYVQNTFPSDLAIGRPDVAEDALCTNAETGHTKTNLYTGGICATEGTINLAFDYMMSQVEVHLLTTDPSATDHVELTGAVVEITNLYSAGDVKLGDRECIPTGVTDNYTMHVMSGGGNENKRHDAIVPQTLTYTTPGVESNVRFKITIYKNGDPAQGIDDIYFADVAPILKSGSSDKIAPNGKWESGMHYIYNLKIAKSQIEVTATFKDWVTVTADESIWF